jgi:outer membrane protein
VKKISIVLSGVALATAMGLATSCNNAGTPTTPTTTSSSTSVAAGDMPIAYVNSDTLLANYKLLDDLRKILEEKREKAEKQLAGRGSKLEEEMGSFQRRMQAGLLSNNEAKSQQEALLKKRDDLMNLEKTLTAGLMEEEKLMNARLYDSLMSFLKDYNKDKKYKYILNYTKGGSIFLADEALNITNEVTKGMNERYEASKAAK